MAEYNGNDIYLRMNGIDVEARWRQMDIARSVGDEDVTAGAGVEYEKHAAKLKAGTAKITLMYDDTQAATDMSALYNANSIITVVYGPEGNATGKPCDNRSWLITGITGPSTAYDKPAVMLEFDLVASGTPTKDIHKGETF